MTGSSGGARRRTSGVRQSIHKMLSDGYGVEDIAVRLQSSGTDVSTFSVRQEISRLRATGGLGRVLGINRKGGAKTLDTDR